MLDAPRDFAALRKTLTPLVKRGIKWVHIDVMDGKFVPRNTLKWQNAALVKKLEKTFPSLRVEVHLMVQNPAYFFRAFKTAGADLVYFHFETCSSMPHALQLAGKLKELGVDSGVAINPLTKVEQIKNIAQAFDSVLVMSVQPGKGGQKFRTSALAKIRKLHSMDCHINVDGGMKAENITQVRKAGANRAVIGTGIFHGNPLRNLQELKRQLVNPKSL